MEIWDLYDASRSLTGKTHRRGDPIPEGYYHLAVHVWLRAPDGRYLMSRRAASRPTFPLMWECVGGSVITREDSYQGALREVYEEVGIDLNGLKGEVLFTKTREMVDGKIFRDIMDAWLFELPDGVEAKLDEATTDEVCECRFMTREEIFSLYHSGELVETLLCDIEKIP